MRILCVAEKPSQAKAVVQILSQGQFGTRDGCSRYNKNYDFQYRVDGAFVAATMTSVLGHVVDLDFPQAMRKWHSCNPASLFTAPIVHGVEERCKDVARNIEREARTATHLYIWTDCDREGESIGNEIAEIGRAVRPQLVVRRAHFSSVLPQEIHRAMQAPRELDMRLVAAVQARTELDLRIGSALTRFQTLRLQSRFAAVQNRVVSYGPCQFPTLGFVVDQFRRVEGFVPEPFWHIFLEHVKSDGRATFLWRRQRLFDQEACFALYARCVHAPAARVVTARSRPQEKWRPLPLTTVELQKCCARFLRLSPDSIMSIAEGLYNQGFVSYPRTETDQFDRNMDLQGIVAKLTQFQPLADYAQRLAAGEFRWPRQGRNNDKAHPPIHPVAAAHNLTGDPKRVYEFITRRFLACCSDNAKGQATEIEVEVAGERFHTKGLAIVARNYLDVYPYDRWSESTVPVYSQGDTFEPTTLEMRSGTTTAPKLLTDADLVDAMEKNGIGTDATHAEHIKKIIDREYVFKSREGFLTPSTLGIGLVEGYDDIGLELSLSKPYLRREMERELRRICDGTKTQEEVVRESVALYQAVYTRSVEQIDRLEQALSRCLDEPPLEAAGGGWTPGAADAGAEEVSRCSGCGNGSLTLRARASGGWMVGCSLYPQCKRVVWVPAAVSAISVAADQCPSCAAARLLEIHFKPGSAPPGTPSPYRGCILGCDELINELFETRFTAGAAAQRPPQNHPSPSSHPPRQNHPPPAAAQQQMTQQQMTQQQMGQMLQQYRFTGHDQPPHPQNGTPGAPPCGCGAPSIQRVTAKEGPNKGRPFFVCAKGRDARCDFFQWADQPSTGSSSGASGGGHGSVMSSGGYNNAMSSGGYSNATSSGGYSNTVSSGGYGQQPYSDPPTTKPKCKCGLYAALKTKNGGGDNQGREYYLCTREFRGCGFVCWKDEVEAYNAAALARPPPAAGSGSGPGSSSGSSGSCFKCGQTGHWSRECPGGGGAGSDAGPSSFAPPQARAAGGPSRRGRARGKSRAPSTRGRGRGRGRGAGPSHARAGSGDDRDFADPDPDFAFWS
ncbi:DNA topoisomerase 3-alpha [Coemansia javaensis]|uniref:DNA topoisomerase n=1 Tax=Coemansia javaensis TaxID=2761396 RepID=A0A9W8HGV6_9FUNG|nr:DNA topoisomerase 3-alpha [Coemansia javaensis]